MNLMQALIKSAPGKTELQKIAVPVPGPCEVLVRVRAAALCGTDLHIHDWNQWAQSAGIQLPVVLGHECCGDVVSVGSAVNGIAVGDKVAAETHIPCGHCYQCLNGEQHICNNLKLFGIHTNGCFAEYAVIPAICARKIPSEVTYEIGAVLEPLGTAFRAAYESQVAGANVVVIGCGPIGLFAVASAAMMGAASIIATDISSSRLDIALKMGAATGLDSLSPALVQSVLDITGGYGADAIIDASGSVDALRQSFQYLRKGGRLTLIGLPGRPIELNLGTDVVFKEAKINGIHGRKMFETWTRMENALVSGKLAVSNAITHILPLADWQKGIDLAKSGQACKVVFRP